jgi:hypothetical protein
MSFAFKIFIFFLIFCFISVLVYFLVVRAFYWGNRKGPPGKDR